MGSDTSGGPLMAAPSDRLTLSIEIPPGAASEMKRVLEDAVYQALQWQIDAPALSQDPATPRYRYAAVARQLAAVAGTIVVR